MGYTDWESNKLRMKIKFYDGLFPSLNILNITSELTFNLSVVRWLFLFLSDFYTNFTVLEWFLWGFGHFEQMLLLYFRGSLNSVCVVG